MIKPMMCKSKEEPFDDVGWITEPKLDGERTIALVNRGRVELWTRSGKESTKRYPEVVEALKHIQLPCALDGEIIASTPKAPYGHFRSLATRNHLTRPFEIAERAKKLPLTYVPFDCLHADGDALTSSPIEERKRVMALLLKAPPSPGVQICPSLDEGGGAVRVYHALRDKAQRLSLAFEGVVMKRKGSAYREGARSPDWIKIKNMRQDEFVVVGATWGEGRRRGLIGALFIAAHDANGRFCYRGKVGTGFSDDDLQWFTDALQESAVPPTVEQPSVTETGHEFFWCKPEIVIEVRYQEMTPDRRLRFPSFLGLRDDKPPTEVRDPEVQDTG